LPTCRSGESELFEELDGRTEQERPLRRAAGGRLGDGLDESAAGTSDLVASALQRRPCDALTAMFLST
jgi:hypothetical protein